MDIIINADDYGWNKTCTLAILEAFRKGYITTTTMCANGYAFDLATEQIMLNQFNNQVGIHFVLTEGIPLTDSIKRNRLFCDNDGVYHGKINRYKYLNSSEQNEVFLELKAQVEKMKQAGFIIQHADSHHHIHTAPFITPIVCAVMKEYGIEGLRLHRNIGNISWKKVILKKVYNRELKRKNYAYSDYFGSFADLEYNSDILKRKGTLEIMCHPDFDKNGNLIDRAGEASYEAPFGDELARQYVLTLEA